MTSYELHCVLNHQPLDWVFFFKTYPGWKKHTHTPKAPHYWPLALEYTGIRRFSVQMVSNAESVSMAWRHYAYFFPRFHTTVANYFTGKGPQCKHPSTFFSFPLEAVIILIWFPVTPVNLLRVFKWKRILSSAKALCYLFIVLKGHLSYHIIMAIFLTHSTVIQLNLSTWYFSPKCT